MESLATQTLVLFVIRTAARPWTSRPSVPLAATTLLIVAIGAALPYMPFAAGVLGFEPLPMRYLGFLAATVGVYLVVVEIVKEKLIRRLWPEAR